MAGAAGLEGFELVVVLEELAAEVGLVADDFGEGVVVEDEAFTLDAGDGGVEVEELGFEAGDLGDEADEDEAGRVAFEEVDSGRSKKRLFVLRGRPGRMARRGFGQLGALGVDDFIDLLQEASDVFREPPSLVVLLRVAFGVLGDDVSREVARG